MPKRRLRDEVDRVGAELPAVTTAGVGAGTGGPPAPPTPGGPEPVGPNAPIPSYVRRAVSELPARRGVRAPTHGLVFDASGHRLAAERSGKDPRAADGLTSASRMLLSATDHVEGHVAALMRRGDLPGRVVLLVNNHPCAGPMGCHAMLRDWIGTGHRIDLYVADQSGPRWSGAYEGTGKGLRR